MSGWVKRGALIAAVAVGSVLGLTKSAHAQLFLLWFLVWCGSSQLLLGLLLASGVLRPGQWWCYSPIGQALQGVASLLLAYIFWAGFRVPEPLGWFLAASMLVLFFLGQQTERKSRARFAAQ